MQVGTCWWNLAVCSSVWLFVHSNRSDHFHITNVTLHLSITDYFVHLTILINNWPINFIKQRWTALPGEPPPLDDTDVDDWLPRFTVLHGLCIFFYLLSTGFYRYSIFSRLFDLLLFGCTLCYCYESSIQVSLLCSCAYNISGQLYFLCNDFLCIILFHELGWPLRYCSIGKPQWLKYYIWHWKPPFVRKMFLIFITCSKEIMLVYKLLQLSLAPHILVMRMKSIVYPYLSSLKITDLSKFESKTNFHLLDC